MKAVRVSLTKSSSELTLKTPNVILAMVQRLVLLYYFLLFKTAKYISQSQAFLDSMPLSNSSVLFGPYCEYALAQVARLIKVLLMK